MKLKLLPPLLFLTVFAQTAASRPETPVAETDSLGSYDMEEMVVTVTRTPLSVLQSPVITRVITAADINRTGATDLPQLLERELAGVEFHQAGYGTSMSFQGLDARYVLFLVDGERMAGETYGNPDYQRIPLSSIQRIEVVRGASSALYGSNAMGAVVNVITRRPERPVEIGANVRYGTNFQNDDNEAAPGNMSEADAGDYRRLLDRPNLSTDLYLGLHIGKVRLRTSGFWRSSDANRLNGKEPELRHYDTLDMMRPKMAVGPGGMPMPEMQNGIPVFVVGRRVTDTSILVPPDPRGLSVSGLRVAGVSQSVEYEPSDRFRFTLTGSYYDKERYDYAASIMDDNPLSGVVPSSKPWTYETCRAYNLKALIEHAPNDRSRVSLSYVRDGYRRSERTLRGPRTPKQDHSYDNPRFLWTVKIGGANRLTAGAEMLREQLRFDLNPDGFDDRKTMATVSVFAQDEILYGRPLSFIAGIRGSWSDRFGWQASPTLSAKYTVGGLSLRANYSRGFRSPSLKELYMDLNVPLPGSPRVVGNDALKPETNNYLSLSAQYASGRLMLSAAVNGSFFRNKIDVRGTTDDDGSYVLRYENLSRSRYASLELTGRIRIARELYLRADYNYIFSRDDGPSESTQYIFPSPHSVTVSADFSFMLAGLRIALNADLRWTGPKDYEDFMPYLDGMDAVRRILEGDLSAMADMKNVKYWQGAYSSRHEGYIVCDASVSIGFPRFGSLTFGIENITGYRPPVVNFNSALLPPKSGFVKLSFRL